MQPYSARPLIAVLQVLWDLAAIATIAAAVWISRQVREAIASLGAFGDQIQDAGDGFATTLSDAGGALGQVPFVGESVAAPFRDASVSATALAAAGESLRASIIVLADSVGTALWLLPTLLVLVSWLLPRIRGSVRAASVARIAATEGGRNLLALRALMTQPPARLLAVSPDPASAYRMGDPAAVEALAALHLRSTGARARADRMS